MKAMILAAGGGTRLHPLTYTLPKPMVPMANVPVMEHIVRLLARHGFREIAVNLNYLPQSIVDCFGDGSNLGVQITYSWEDELLGTAGGVKKMRDFFRGEDFLVIGGDDLTDFNLAEIYASHQARRALATIGLTPAEDPSLYGVVAIDETGRIRQFQEKPPREEAKSHLVNTGVYFFRPDVFEWIPDGFYDFGRQLFPRILEEGLDFYGFPARGYWCDIGSLTEYWRAHVDVLSGHVDLLLPGREIAPGVRIQEGAVISATAFLQGPVLIGPGAVVEDGAHLQGPCVLGPRVHVGPHARLRECILWDDTQVGASSDLQRVMLGERCQVAPGTRARDEVMGGHSRIGSLAGTTP